MRRPFGAISPLVKESSSLRQPIRSSPVLFALDLRSCCRREKISPVDYKQFVVASTTWIQTAPRWPFIKAAPGDREDFL